MKKPNHDMWKERWCGREKFNGLSFIALFSLSKRKRVSTRRRSPRRARTSFPSVYTHAPFPVSSFYRYPSRSSFHRYPSRARRIHHPSDTRNDTVSYTQHASSSSILRSRTTDVPIHRNAKALLRRRHDACVCYRNIQSNTRMRVSGMHARRQVSIRMHACSICKRCVFFFSTKNKRARPRTTKTTTHTTTKKTKL